MHYFTSLCQFSHLSICILNCVVPEVGLQDMICAKVRNLYLALVICDYYRLCIQCSTNALIMHALSLIFFFLLSSILLCVIFIITFGKVDTLSWNGWPFLLVGWHINVSLSPLWLAFNIYILKFFCPWPFLGIFLIAVDEGMTASL